MRDDELRHCQECRSYWAYKAVQAEHLRCKNAERFNRGARVVPAARGRFATVSRGRTCCYAVPPFTAVVRGRFSSSRARARPGERRVVRVVFLNPSRTTGGTHTAVLTGTVTM